MTDAYADLADLIRERGRELLAAATLLAGGPIAGEDLLQSALERTMRAWRRIEGPPEGYLRRTMYHLAVDGWRLRRRRPEVLTFAEPRSHPDDAEGIALRQALIASLAQLPPRQRAVLVLRYFEQLTEAEAADVLGCSLGNIKSTTSRALAKLRETATAWNGEPQMGARR
jgi:RNA polymerase sigma-70 factor (sigma-E family)